MGILECVSNTDKRLFLIDTPGFDDTHKSDTDILREVADWLQRAYQNRILLSGIIYLHRVTDVRMGGSAMKNLRMFKKLCGDDRLANVVLATTMWSSGVDEKTALYREEQLRTQPDFWAKMVEKGSKIFRHDRGAESATEIVNYLISRKQRVVLDIQRELVDERKALQETAAGTEIQAEIERLRRCLKDELLEMQKEMQKAISSRDQQYQREIEDMKRNILGMLKQSEADKEKLRADKDELRRQMEREEYQRRQEARAREREIEDLRRRLAHMEQAAAKRPDPGAGYMPMYLMMIQDLNHRLDQREREGRERR